jgi:hypothetical protein
MEIFEIADQQAFEAIGPEWNELLRACAGRNVYLTHEFVFTWWKHLGLARGGVAVRPGGWGSNSWTERLAILAAREDGRLIGIAPLAIVNTEIRGAGAPLRLLCFIGDSLLTRYRDFVLEKGREGEILDAFWTRIATMLTDSLDVVFLGNMHEESASPTLSVRWLRAHPAAALRFTQFKGKAEGGLTPDNLDQIRIDLRIASQSAGSPPEAREALETLVMRSRADGTSGDPHDSTHSIGPSVAAIADAYPALRPLLKRPLATLQHDLIDLEYPYIPLPSTWEDYKATVTPSMRRNFNHEANKLARLGSVTVERICETVDPDRDLADLIRLHQAAMGDESLTLNDQTAGFHREMLQVGVRNGWLRLSFVTLDGRRVGVLESYHYDGRRHLAILGRDPRIAASVGMLSLRYAIEDAIQSGAREVDLGPGNMRYKFHLTKHARRVNNLIVTKPAVEMPLKDLLLGLFDITRDLKLGSGSTAPAPGTQHLAPSTAHFVTPRAFTLAPGIRTPRLTSFPLDEPTGTTYSTISSGASRSARRSSAT